MSDCIDMKVVIQHRPDLWQLLPAAVKAVPTELYTMGDCRIIISFEPKGYHLSISCENRLPNYGEIVTARYRLLPHIREMAMFFPSMDEFVNVHPYTLHLFQTR
mgnify:FL=1